MGLFNHVGDDWIKVICGKCGCAFEWYEQDLPYEGCKDPEEVRCPNCHDVYTSFMTNGIIHTRSLEEK